MIIRIPWNSQRILLACRKISALVAGSDSISAAWQFPQDILHSPNKQPKTESAQVLTGSRKIEYNPVCFCLLPKPSTEKEKKGYKYNLIK